MLTIFYRFFILGLISFGGPIAHIGYFQKEFVEKRKWLSESSFTEALALCQFLPGPASSQLGMYIGYHQAGYLGACMAFIGFTLPSFLILTFTAMYTHVLADHQALQIFISAAKLLAAIVVLDAIVTMFKKFIIDKLTLIVCFISVVWIFISTGLFAQLSIIIISGIFGLLIHTNTNTEYHFKSSVHSKHTFLLLALFIFLLIFPALFKAPIIQLFHYFYQAGSLVFGGGHVVLPLLEPLIGQHISSQVLIEGYAAAQLIPGPMFTIASYIGASFENIHPFVGSLIATIAIFLPGALLLFAALPVWKSVLAHSKLAGAVIYINAAVVGLLIAAFFTPILTSAIHQNLDFIALIFGFIALKKFGVSIFVILLALVGYTGLQYL